LVSGQDLANISAGVLVQLFIISKYYDSHINGTENRELMRLLEETAFALEKGSGEKSELVKTRWFFWRGGEGRGGKWRRVAAEETYTERFRSSLMALISIFLLPIAATRRSCGR
jgi:hypothetical protein